MPKPKPILSSDIAQALDLAVQYRLRGENNVAESICLDVLTQDADNQIALEVLLRVYACSIERGSKTALVDARGILARLNGPSTQAFCNGLI